MSSEKVEQLKQALLDNGFSLSELRTVALVLMHVRKEKTIHYYRFSGPTRPVVDRLVTLKILKREGQDIKVA